MRKPALALVLLLLAAPGLAREAAPAPVDPALAKELGADARGMRRYVLVVLKTGPTRVADPTARQEMFKGHFANMERLAAEGKLALAGPFAEKTDWRGLFILAVDGIDQAKELVATDPVVSTGEMVAEYHTLYATAALMAVNGIHKRIQPK
jgi:uncharacterized protein YciI